ncbi:MAG: Ppx/GppA phosphatase family protein [Pseudanabaenaceae cyanobacterium bins.68]|nr:Ppx/GppA phosphatase family protein [Pseudanabaenaceae cyanobacterium bins.68]
MELTLVSFYQFLPLSLVSSMPPEKIIAAIDIGTNSIHMVVVRIQPNLPSFTIITSEKATVRLGERCTKTGNLLPEAIQRSLVALQRCRDICQTLKVEAIIAVATSATREAPNGLEFLELVEQQTGIEVELISGQEEARRIYLGVLSAMEFEGKPHVVFDIGGGSSELILGDGHDPEYLSSTKIGAVRLTELFVQSDPVTNSEFERLQSYVRGMIERPTDELRQNLKGHPVRMIGTSGTIEAIAILQAKDKNLELPANLHGYQITLAEIERVVQRLKKSQLSDRIAWVKEKRAEIILAGGVILLETMRLLGASQITLCTRALREGLIVDWMINRGLIEDRLRYQSSVRDRSVLKLAHKYQVNLNYSHQVAKLALSLFDQTQGTLHNSTEMERKLLWAAAILHNSGHFISHDAHHKHSYYLIRHGGLLGHTETEIEAIANLARYHRRSEPKKRHDNYRRLSTNRRLRQFVDQIYPLLRLAVALDRRQIKAVAAVKLTCQPKSRQCLLEIVPTHPDDPCTLERWSLEYKKIAFEQQYQMQLAIVGPTPL